jgi:hypothetical protein
MRVQYLQRVECVLEVDAALALQGVVEVAHLPTLHHDATAATNPATAAPCRRVRLIPQSSEFAAVQLASEDFRLAYLEHGKSFSTLSDPG